MVYEKKTDKWVITVSMIFIGYKKQQNKASYKAQFYLWATLFI